MSFGTFRIGVAGSLPKHCVVGFGLGVSGSGLGVQGSVRGVWRGFLGELLPSQEDGSDAMGVVSTPFRDSEALAFLAYLSPRREYGPPGINLTSLRA